jgi:NAD(P)-dependent dehydrogenase (short-subunit alcohol dehydrogenase family)
MKHVIITGSTRGIGYGLADAFLDLDCSITVSGRNQNDVEQATTRLSAKHSADRVLGLGCDVRQPDQVQALWDQTTARFQKVDIWINNAGYSGPQMAAWKMPPEKAKEVIDTNVLGVMYGCMVAVREMLEQGFGAIYNMEGMGSDGRKHEGLTYYGTSKYGLRYFTDSLVKETDETPIVIGALRPGMVVTELLTKQYEHRPEDWERDKRIFNILADRVETVTPWLAKRILENGKTGARISWTSPWKIMGRFLVSPFYKRDVLGET